MVINKGTNPPGRKQDFVYVAISLAIAAGIGVYLIATTVLIAKDGVFYIEQAQKIANNESRIVTEPPPGYPILIALTYRLVALFNDSPSIHVWIYSAQSLTLFCRLLSLIPLYYLGKSLVGARRSFWALLVLIVLPHPARFGSDVLREWPYILLLATGLLLLFWGAQNGKWWAFGAAALIAGFGYVIRPECVQLVLYGIFWLVISVFRNKRRMTKFKLFLAMSFLIIGFLVPATVYTVKYERLLPEKLGRFIDAGISTVTRFFQAPSEENFITSDQKKNKEYKTPFFGKTAKAFAKLAEEICDNLMYFFVPALLLGISHRFRKRSQMIDVEKLLMPVFIMVNIVMAILLYYHYGYISRRHCLPLVVFTIFYVPVGLHVWADWLKNIFLRVRPRTSRNSQFYFSVLLAIGIAICLPKLFRPLRTDKYGYREAANWLKKNTPREAIIATPDPRISLYAQREKIVYKNDQLPSSMDYLIRIVNSKDDMPDINNNAQKKNSFWVNEKKSKKRIVIYQWKD